MVEDLGQISRAKAHPGDSRGRKLKELPRPKAKAGGAGELERERRRV